MSQSSWFFAFSRYSIRRLAFEMHASLVSVSPVSRAHRRSSIVAELRWYAASIESQHAISCMTEQVLHGSQKSCRWLLSSAIVKFTIANALSMHLERYKEARSLIPRIVASYMADKRTVTLGKKVTSNLHAV
jgi:hypothetical protein